MKKRFISTISNEYLVSEFQHNIETMRKDYESYIETIVAYCDENSLDVDEVIHLISVPLSQKIKDEYQTKSDDITLPFESYEL